MRMEKNSIINDTIKEIIEYCAEVLFFNFICFVYKGQENQVESLVATQFDYSKSHENL